LSKEEQWRSFPKVPNLPQYVSNDKYYGRIKIGEKVIRESLKMDVWSTAELRLPDFFKRHQEAHSKVNPPKFRRKSDQRRRQQDSASRLNEGPDPLHGVTPQK